MAKKSEPIEQTYTINKEDIRMLVAVTAMSIVMSSMSGEKMDPDKIVAKMIDVLNNKDKE